MFTPAALGLGARPHGPAEQVGLTSDSRSCKQPSGRGLLLVLLAAHFVVPGAFATEAAGRPSGAVSIAANSSPVASAAVPAQAGLAHQPKRAFLGKEAASPETLHVAHWVVDSGDNQGMPFMIVDKVHARVLMFDAGGQLKGAAPALLGLALGDDSVPGIGDRKLSTILPEERTTPAGRFVASLARDLHGKEILWVDYATAISLHKVIAGKPSERRAQRLDSATPEDNRVSYGCINVPVKFYEKVVSPTFTGTNGVVYVLPETRTAREVFGSYDVNEREQLQVAKQAVTFQTAAPSAAIVK